jgi:hypothetical protein
VALCAIFLREVSTGGDEKDKKPMRVGKLERVKPTFLLIDTPKHKLIGHPGLL